MKKRELIDAVANEVRIAKSAAAMFQHRRECCANGSHPKTAAALRIAESTTVKFTAGRLFKDAVNQ